MPDYRTPGVYINEIPHFPPSISQVETAIPAFIGYTQKSGDGLFIAKRITSLIEFEQIYGIAYPERMEAKLSDAASEILPKIEVSIPSASPYLLYYQISMFYNNGGGPCYIIAVGSYDSTFNVDKTALLKGLEACKVVDEVALLAIPEIVNLIEDEDIKELNDAMLAQCNLLKDRFAILDVPEKNEGRMSLVTEKFRKDFVGADNLKFGAAYTPKLETILNYNRAGDDLISINDQRINKIKVNGLDDNIKLADIKLLNYVDLYNLITTELHKISVSLYPSGAIAGVYSLVDSTRGVWKAPANVSLNNVVKPLIKIDNADQDDLNITPTGKSINAIRTFTGKGTLVWGARTLNGNDNEYRYISVRRFVNMVEESIAKAIQQFIFEPNDANTWSKIKSMCENFLLILWKQGALQGAKPEDAFAIQIGLNSTMSSLDILEGRLIMQVMMAVVRPAEFIIVSITLRMQES